MVLVQNRTKKINQPKKSPLKEKKLWFTLAFSLVVLSMASLSSTVMSSTFPLSGFRFPSFVDSRGKVAPKKKVRINQFLQMTVNIK